MPTRRHPEVKNVLVLRGGAGAYHIGAYQALQAGLWPDWVTGISIGALNAAVLATNKLEERLRKMVEFWEDIARPITPLPVIPARIAPCITSRWWPSPCRKGRRISGRRASM